MRRNMLRLDEDTISETVFVQTPYSAEFVERLKAAVPIIARDPRRVPGRGWNQRDDRMWGIAAEYLDPVLAIAEEIWPDLEVIWS